SALLGRLAPGRSEFQRKCRARLSHLAPYRAAMRAADNKTGGRRGRVEWKVTCQKQMPTRLYQGAIMEQFLALTKRTITRRAQHLCPNAAPRLDHKTTLFNLSHGLKPTGFKGVKLALVVFARPGS